MRNGSGTYVLPSPVNPVATGTTITSTWANTTLTDVSNELTNSLPRDGQAPMTANLPMGGYKVSGMGNGTASGDAVNIGQLGDTSNTALGAALIGYKSPLSGAIAKTLYQKQQEVVSALDFGLVGDGSTDNSVAWQNIISFVNGRLNGTSVFFPDGVYKAPYGLPAITNSNVIFYGSGRDNAVIQCTTGGAIFTFTGANYIGLKDIGFKYTGTPAVTDKVFQLNNSNHFIFTQIRASNIAQFCSIGDSSGTNPCSDITFDNFYGYCANVAVNFVTVNKGAGLWLSNCTWFCNSGVPVNNRVSTMTTAVGCNALSFGNFSWDSVQITNCQFEQFYYGLYVSTAIGSIVNNFYISNTIFDYCSQTCVLLNAGSAVSGGIFGIRLSNIWLASWSGDCLDINGPGICQGITADSVHFISAGVNGCQIGGGTQKDIILSNISIGAVNRIAGVASGIYIASGDRITITNCRGGYDNTPLGFAWQATLGLNLGGTASNLLATNNHFEGATAAYYLTGGTLTNSLLTNNLNANYAGNQTGIGIYTTPATTVVWTNTAATTVEVSIYGGTVTVIKKNTIQIGTSGPATFTLQPGDSYSITYTVTPTIIYMVKS